MIKNYLLAGTLSMTLLLACSKKDVSPTTTTTTQTKENLKTTTQKPATKPNITNNVKNEAGKSVRVTTTTASTALGRVHSRCRTTTDSRRRACSRTATYR